MFATINPGRVAHAQTTAQVTVNPAYIANVTQTTGTVVFTVSLTNSPSIDSFAVSLSYNRSILHAADLSFANNVLGTNAQVGEECIDGQWKAGFPCQPWDGPGVITLFLFGSTTPPPTTGPLFQTTFNVTGRGLSQIHIFRMILLNSAQGAQIPASTLDGYFVNVDCPVGSGVPCKPPVADFVISPTPVLSTGSPATFNATLSHPTNAGSAVTLSRYTWNWGDNSVLATTLLPLIQHVYTSQGEFSVTLTVTDTYGISWSTTKTVEVTRLFIDLAVKGLSIDQGSNFSRGIQAHISALVQNNSTLPENATARITVGNQVLLTERFLNMAPFGSTASIFATWNTTAFSPGQYSVQAYVDPVAGENNTINNIVTRHIELLPTPDFNIGASPSSLVLDLGSEGSVAITLTSFFGFTGIATLAANSTITLPSSFNGNPLSLSPGSSVVSVLTIGAWNSLTPGTYILRVTANIGSFSHSVDIPIRVEASPSLSHPDSSPMRILGLQPLQFWGLTSSILAVLVTAGALAYRKRRRTFYM